MIDTSTIPAAGEDIRSLTRTALVNAEPSVAWRDWASAATIAQWWQPPASNIDLRVGGPFEILFNMDASEGTRGSEGCRYLSYVPGEMISFTWNAPPHLALRSANTWVVITFTPTGSTETEVRLVHTGFLSGQEWDEYIEYFGSAWEYVLDLQRNHHADRNPATG
ncbi:MAG: SRPBCC family protein [Acidimicrobiia bacterium]